MTPTDSQTLERLVRLRAWLRTLARGLVRDDSRADDLCHDALLQALGKPAAAQRRPWLARAVRSLAARLARDEHRRSCREHAAARAERQPSAAQVVEQVATQRQILDAVMELDEPYRSTILLRYWDDLPPRDVARRTGVAVETARTRLKRGLQLLRERLDREFGSRGEWVMPLMNWPSFGNKNLTIASGATFVKTKMIAVAAILAAGLALTWAASKHVTELAPVPSNRPSSVAERAAGVAGPPTPLDRTAVSMPLVAEDTGPSEAPELLRGRVLNATATPLAGARVRLVHDSELPVGVESSARSDASGQFSLPRPAIADEVVVEEAGLTTVLAGVFQPGNTAEPVVIAAPSLTLGGLVLGENGERLAQAQVTCRLPEDFRARFREVLDFSRQEPWTVRADQDGSFRLPDLGRVDGSELLFSKDGYVSQRLPQPGVSNTSMQIVLRKPQPVEGNLLGQVVGPGGAPIADAQVSLGDVSTVSGDDGRFTIEMQEAGKNLEIIAMKRGYLPGLYRLQEWDGEFSAAEQRFATVRLGGLPLSISGELVDSLGRPVAGAKVWVTNPTVFGNGGLGLLAVEGYLSGGMTEGELRDRFMRDSRPDQAFEQVLDEHPTAKWSWANTEESGRFTLGGLQDRPYELSVLLPETLVHIDGGEFPAGTAHARIVIPEGSLVPAVAGRVTNRNGLPIAGVQVQMNCDALKLRRQTYGPDGGLRVRGSRESVSGRLTQTDEDGRFRFADVGANLVYLALTGDQIIPSSFGRSGGLATVDQPLGELRITVSMRLHLRVELADPSFADTVSAVDASGRQVDMWLLSGGGEYNTHAYFTLHQGRSEVLAAPEGVTALVLSKNGKEVQRIPVRLSAGEVNVIHG